MRATDRKGREVRDLDCGLAEGGGLFARPQAGLAVHSLDYLPLLLAERAPHPATPGLDTVWGVGGADVAKGLAHKTSGSTWPL